MTVALAYASSLGRMVEIGLGGGRMATYIHDHVPQTKLTCVELDPGVIDLAQLHFDVKPGPRLELVTGDGRIYMARAKEKFDVILADAYQGTYVPFHLVTREFYAILKKKLAPGGVVAQNIAPSVLSMPRMVATARAVFANVDLYRAGTSYVLVAHEGRRNPGRSWRRAPRLCRTPTVCAIRWRRCWRSGRPAQRRRRNRLRTISRRSATWTTTGAAAPEKTERA